MTRQTISTDAVPSSLDGVVEFGVPLADPDDFAAMNAAYSELFPHDPPARHVARLGASVPGILVSVAGIGSAAHETTPRRPSCAVDSTASPQTRSNIDRKPTRKGTPVVARTAGGVRTTGTTSRVAPPKACSTPHLPSTPGTRRTTAWPALMARCRSATGRG